MDSLWKIRFYFFLGKSLPRDESETRNCHGRQLTTRAGQNQWIV